MSSQNIDINEIIEWVIDNTEKSIAIACGFICFVFILFFLFGGESEAYLTPLNQGKKVDIESRPLADNAWNFLNKKNIKNGDIEFQSYTMTDFKEKEVAQKPQKKENPKEAVYRKPEITDFQVIPSAINPMEIIISYSLKDSDKNMKEVKILTGDGDSYILNPDEKKVHAYQKTGSYIVRLEAHEKNGKTQSMTKEIEINRTLFTQDTRIDFKLEFNRLTSSDSALVTITTKDKDKIPDRRIIKVGENLYGFTIKNISNSEIRLEKEAGQEIRIPIRKSKVLTGNKEEK